MLLLLSSILLIVKTLSCVSSISHYILLKSFVLASNFSFLLCLASTFLMSPNRFCRRQIFTCNSFISFVISSIFSCCFTMVFACRSASVLSWCISFPCSGTELAHAIPAHFPPTLATP
ncbi:hypothetical protein GOP47_0002192 [Adiantum capillus-veneris]|uniref:Secreted peptide n=1 Tax=Adiantum capillus-veneris TaxID=13818 RepID=A0A9D4ZNZ1_ADICA|nr:hypothetical protein GOP47_0002192 [Adiantum capillus-veneris]